MYSLESILQNISESWTHREGGRRGGGGKDYYTVHLRIVLEECNSFWRAKQAVCGSAHTYMYVI